MIKPLVFFLFLSAIEVFAIEPYEKGLLLNEYTKSGLSKIAFCKANACSEIKLDKEVGGKFELFQNGHAQYIIKGEKAWFSWDVKKGVLQIIPNISSYLGVVHYINQSISIGFNHKYTHTEIVMAKGPEKEKTFPDYKKLKPGKFHFFPDGRHIFVNIPGMGKSESPYFIDILDSPQYLYYAKNLGEKHQLAATLPKGDGFMYPQLVNRGKTVIFWRPGGFNKQDETKTLYLDSVDLKTKKISRHYTLKIDFKSGHYFRGTPKAFYFDAGPYVMVPKNFSTKTKPKNYLLIHLENNETKEVNELNKNILPPISRNILKTSSDILKSDRTLNYQTNYIVVQTFGQEFQVLNCNDLSVAEKYPLPSNIWPQAGDYID